MTNGIEPPGPRTVETEPTSPTLPATIEDVPGWFHQVDQLLFGWFLDHQQHTPAGDIVELGAYLGKSTILLGEHLRPADRLVVCDLFGLPAPDEDNAAESSGSYTDLTRAGFEFNYLAFHERLPQIVQTPTSEILGYVAPDSCRFVHVDASHLYKHVRGDVTAARTLLRPDGIVVFDDYRSPHTPGVSAAVWEAVIEHGLKPIALSPQKFYGTWGDAESLRRELTDWANGHPGFAVDVQEVIEHRLTRVTYKPPKAKPKSAPKPTATPPPAAQPAAAPDAAASASSTPPESRAGASSRPAPTPKSGVAAAPKSVPSASAPKPADAKPAGAPKPPPSRTRKLARDLLPPIVTRRIRNLRNHR